MTTTLTKPRTEGDVVIRNFDPEYCYDSVTITNNSGAERDFVPGTPFNESGGTWDPTQDTEEASIDGILVEHVKGLANNGTKVVRMLVRGPAVLNRDALPTVDYTNTAFNLATVATRLLALSPPIICRREPTKVSQQTT
jgi:hypothetical protein